MSKQPEINIRNKKAGYEFELLEKYLSGIMLYGTEIKSIREGKASIQEAYCLFIKDELWVRNMDVSEYSHGSDNNHEPKRDRKLLLNSQELTKLQKKISQKGLTIIPTRLFINERGLAKLEIALARGKKLYDKRETLRKKDTAREIERSLKQ